MKVIFYSRCCIMGSGVDILARKIRLASYGSGGGIINYTLQLISLFGLSASHLRNFFHF